MMKKRLFLTIIALTSLVAVSMAQATSGTEVKYRRSSLHTMLVESDKFPQKETIIKAFYNAPFPDKYNNHVIGEKSFDPAQYPLNAEEKALIYKPQSKAGAIASNAVDAKVDSASRELSVKIKKYLDQNKVANKLVAKWFNRKEDGSFDMALIGERGSYNATDMEANIAKGAARGTAALADAGIELIGNTFVVVSKFNFVSNEITAAIVRDAAKIAASQLSIPALQTAANKAADEAYEKAKEGYSVWTTSYLYKLVWNDSIEAVFYNDLWVDKSNIDPKKKEAFDNTNLFTLEFVGDENATGLVLYSAKEKRTEEQVIEVATIRSIDAVYSKLQKKYDVFKPKIPLFTGTPAITAKIGMKEGLEGDEKFEVLEQTLDPKTGLTSYVSKGFITVDKDLIWDNRFNAGEEPVVEGATGPDPKVALGFTTFKGGKKFYPGLLIKQTK
jgi:hypothetical protein